MDRKESGRLGAQQVLQQGRNAWVTRHEQAVADYEFNPKYCLFCYRELTYADREKPSVTRHAPLNTAMREE